MAGRIKALHSAVTGGDVCSTHTLPAFSKKLAVGEIGITDDSDSSVSGS